MGWLWPQTILVSLLYLENTSAMRSFLGFWQTLFSANWWGDESLPPCTLWHCSFFERSSR